MTPERKKERQRLALIEMDNVISEELAELEAGRRARHRYNWVDGRQARLAFCENIRKGCRTVRIQRWIRSMTVRGVAESLGVLR